MYYYKNILRDLDDTLGGFGGVGETLNGIIITDTLLSILSRDDHRDFRMCIRHNIEEILHTLQNLGHQHILTTRATKKYAEKSLERSGLHPFFTKIFSNETLIDENNKKNYAVVAKDLGVIFSELGKNSIIIGNSKNDDPPYNSTGTITILDSHGRENDANLITKTLKYLENSSKHDYRKTFDILYQAKPIHKIDDFELKFAYNETGAPVITIQTKGKYHRKPKKFPAQ